MIEVFLSASVPLPERNRRYFDTADVLAIRESIKALVEIVLPVGRITCGGHPAITPLLSFFVREAGLDRDRLTIFQSRLFEHVFPDENAHFHIKLTDAVENDRQKSLLGMRNEMMRSRRFGAGVFIGGMEGVEEEAILFHKFWPDAKMIPVASTGAAARIIFDSGNFSGDFLKEHTYTTLFRHNLF